MNVYSYVACLSAVSSGHLLAICHMLSRVKMIQGPDVLQSYDTYTRFKSTNKKHQNQVINTFFET